MTTVRNAIIVADDSKVIRNIVEKAIGKDIRVLQASDGMEVIKYIKNREYNILAILLDLNMPIYDGFMVLDYFRNNELFKRIPVSVISGDDSELTIKKAFSYDIVDMLNKPFSYEKIRNIIEKTINQKKV